ncbi:unnamed protein product [Mytilus coruscus]|uniref:Ig-like domain-containing protein n=1 Tax=Mytilus coruscus TaxID=42192 RepID=A0A6J8EA07_MYTCO|nr:unnamed protein product [Mytilus coruscus]
MQWEHKHYVVAHGGPVSIKYTFILDIIHHLNTFSCIAFNNVTRTVLTQTMLLYLYFEPTVKIVTYRTVNITENETLLLLCNYTSNDDNNTSITWKYPSYGRIKYVQANKFLKVEHIKRTGAGEYTCVVSNSAGKANDTVTVNVLYSPEINITFENIKSNKILRCNAYGNPDDYVFSAWEHRTEYGDHIRYLNDNGNGCITLHHSPGETDINHDQGTYTCSVSNGVPYDGKMYRLANYTLKQNDLKYKMEFSKIYDIVYGTKVNIKGYKLFVPIRMSAPAYFTIYTVVVSNAYGQCHISVDLSPVRPPRAPNNLKAVALDHTILVK